VLKLINRITHTTKAPENKIIDFSKVRVGVKNLEDATLELGDFRKVNPRFGNKETVLEALNRGDTGAL